jgi:hypothetical protein
MLTNRRPIDRRRDPLEHEGVCAELDDPVPGRAHLIRASAADPDDTLCADLSEPEADPEIRRGRSLGAGGGPPAPGRDLEEPERKLWRRYTAAYDFPPGDTAGLEILRAAMLFYARARKARERLDEDGLTVLDARGTPKIHPAALVEQQSSAGYLRAVKQLGLGLEPVRSVGRPPNMPALARQLRR